MLVHLHLLIFFLHQDVTWFEGCIGRELAKSLDNRVIRKVSLCFDRFRVHYSHKPMETQSKALEFRGIIHKARV